MDRSGSRLLNATSEPRLLRVKEVAGTLSVSNMTVYRLIHDGQLRAIRVGHGWRISESDLAGFLQRPTG